MNKIIERNEITFESIKHIDENGFEYWLARELMLALEYKRWDKFCNVINNAKTACEKSNNIISDHFSQVGRMVEIGSKTSRTIMDFRLSRYACYLIVQNADPRKETVALGQTYFAIQTRKQEITELEYSKLSEDEKRLYNRIVANNKNKTLFYQAKKSGVENFGKFNNVINNAKIACKKSNYIIEDHFSQVGKMIELAKGARRTILDYKLSRYACYLVV